MEDLITDPVGLVRRLWSPESPISIDRECLCQMGRHVESNISIRIDSRPYINPIIRLMYKCPQCTNMGRLIDLEPSNVNQAFMLECGRDKGKRLILKKISISILKVGLTTTPRQYLENLLRSNREIKACEPTLEDLVNADFMGSDNFTNQILVNWYADYILSLMGLHHINKMHTAFVCGDEGYMLYDHPTLGTLDQFTAHLSQTRTIPSGGNTTDRVVIMKSNVARELLQQLFTTLRILRSYDFSHGETSSRSLLFHDEPVNYSYDGMEVRSEFTLKIADFSKSGITIKGINNSLLRLYNRSEMAENQIEAVPYRPLIQLVKFFPYTSEGKHERPSTHVIYRLSNSSSYIKYNLMFIYLQHMGVPLYQSSFDAYSYMIMLMSNKAFYGAVMEDTKLFSIWRSMWLPEEFDDVLDKIRILHSGEITPMKILSFLSKHGLRCDCTEMVWTSLRNIS